MSRPLDNKNYIICAKCGNFGWVDETGARCCNRCEKRERLCTCTKLEPTKIVSEEDFEKIYLPMTSEKTDSLMWEHKDTLAYPFRQVWSILESFDSDTDKLYAIPGYHIVNVIGYAVTEKEWETDNIEAVYYDYDANGHEGVRKD